MALWKNAAFVLLSALVSDVCLHTGAAIIRRAPSQDSQNWKPFLLCAEEERQCEHPWSSNFTEEFTKCSVVERRYCVQHDQTKDCCMHVAAPTVIEVCSRLPRDSSTAIISCRQFRRELSKTSTVPHSHSSLHVALPRGASSIQIFGLGINPDLSRIYIKANQSQNLFFNSTDLTYKGVKMSIKSNPAGGWYRILVHQRTTAAIGVTFEAVSSVIFHYSIPISEALRQQSGAQDERGVQTYSRGSLFCLLFGGNYHWEHGQLGQCSTTCGIGKRYRPLLCMKYPTRRVVDNSNCACREPPPVKFELCGNTSCEPRWATGRWSNCSITCGQGYQQREVSCVRDISEESFEVVHNSFCSMEEAPSTLQSCEGNRCLHLWVPAPWKECSSRCGPGDQVRDVKCVMLNGTVAPDSACAGQVKPATNQTCNLNPQCYYEWGTLSDWGECNGLCRTSSRGTKHRTVRCIAKHSNGIVLSDSVNETFCVAKHKPIDSAPCEISCNLGEWRVAGIIKECNGSCGSDVYKVKRWACYNQEGNVIDSWKCPKPVISFTSERCNLPPCAPPPNCTDVVIPGVSCTQLILVENAPCNDYFRRICCQTCHSQ